MAINPQITKSYAEGNLAYMHKLIALSSLSCYYLLLLVTVPLLFIADYILQLWLGEVPSFTSVFFKLTMIYTIVNSFGNPVIIGVHATGKIRKFQLVEALIMLLTLPGAYVLLKNGFPASSVYISMIVFAILAQVGRLVVILPKINMSFRKYNQSILMPALKVLLFAFFLYSSLRFLIDKHGLVIDLSFALVSFICLVVAIFYLGLNKEERINLCNFIRKNMNQKRIIRQSNFELLRIVCMYNILLCHMLFHGCNGLQLNPCVSKVSVVAEAFLSFHVNAFLLISGYFGIRFHFKGLLKFILPCAFYSVLIYLLFECSGDLNSININGFLKRFVFICRESPWWFVEKYFYLFLTAPIFNIALKYSKRENCRLY